jgi:hypothetical protein
MTLGAYFCASVADMTRRRRYSILWMLGRPSVGRKVEETIRQQLAEGHSILRLLELVRERFSSQAGKVEVA